MIDWFAYFCVLHYSAYPIWIYNTLDNNNNTRTQERPHIITYNCRNSKRKHLKTFNFNNRKSPIMVDTVFSVLIVVIGSIWGFTVKDCIYVYLWRQQICHDSDTTPWTIITLSLSWLLKSWILTFIELFGLLEHENYRVTVAVDSAYYFSLEHSENTLSVVV